MSTNPLFYQDQIELEEYKKIIKYGTNVNEINDQGYTPLWHLVKIHEKKEFFKVLIEAGADVNYIHPNEGPLILYAIRKNLNTSKIRLFVNAGAKLKWTKKTLLDNNEIKEVHFCTLYSAIVHYASGDIIKLLLKSGIKIDTKNIGKIHPAELVIKNRKGTSRFSMLFECDCDPNVITKNGKLLVSEILNLNYTKILEIIVNHPKFNINKQDYSGNTISHELIKQNNNTTSSKILIDLIKTKFKNKINPDIKNEIGHTVLDLLEYNKRIRTYKLIYDEKSTIKL